ncbi:guanine nucleotide exchange factor subunit Rich-like [Vespa mandarinia]|uniref:guanine nucleotide exchange factor subunit Rich-like n=2 Tax=Vespa TaxID=7443 RepID=UPI00161DA00A|nr:guanine nucleotide exchange factor subunit Rich-like [Vespa mandarinia]XP_035741121.1 guanine nucleotide exchange factor subunit Rich-like [Vespa mandarinia]XP_047362935.1 guanine nucleotide exchange factor subunit Rich isoform X1 [Vespa velutina]XP_047362936.1 guanine nucleotide exchange factor subunit Rich isoform X1 [Vespa velutina]
MFFPIGWPRVLNCTEPDKIKAIVCNRDKILFAILTTDFLTIWYCKPCIPIVFIRRTADSLKKHGENILVQWRPDSSMLVIATSDSYLLFYRLSDKGPEGKSLYEQRDSPVTSLKRDSAELFIKEVIPSLVLSFEKSAWIDGGISSLVCIRDELMVATKTSHVIRHKWDGTVNRDYTLDLRRIPFSVDQQISTTAVPLTENNAYVMDIEYSPLVGGFAIVLSTGKAAFLTAHSLKFDPNQVQGIWAKDVDDATCAAVNHKYRLIAFGRGNSEGIVYYIDETTGALEVSHTLSLSSKDYPGRPGCVRCLRWTPDSCAIALAWEGGGLAIWSTFGALLLCSLKWDYGLRVDLTRDNPLHIHTMEWSAEGYQLWMLRESPGPLLMEENGNEPTHSWRSLIQLDFVKSPLTVNPCMGHHGHLYLQGEDRLYLNLGGGISATTSNFHISNECPGDIVTQTLAGCKQWLVVPIPSAYTGSNWPIRYTAIDNEGLSIAVAGRTGLAHYSLPSRKWKLFGNESQERDFIVTGGLLWHRGFLIASSYSLLDDRDEIRMYPRDTRLDNNYVKSIRMPSQVLLLNTLKERLLTFCANAQISIYDIILDGNGEMEDIELTRIQTVDISGLCVHPACVVSATLTTIRAETAGSHPHPESLLLNVSGRLLMVQREHCTDNPDILFTCSPPTVLASCVENVWVPWRSRRDKPHLTEALWLFCGAHGMRVWLPLFPRNHQEKTHTFMSKRIMLPFHLCIYPLAILFEDAILLGAENDTVLFTSDTNSPFSLPFSLLELTSQVYLHQILRQLIHRNLGYHAWEIARSCSALPYFPHSLELLLHEVLEEEATSKEPIPDAQLPSVVEFIREFPGVWARAVVQCARKTEIALWPYLFSVAGPPKKLLQDCLQRQQLDTAASYLIILQNLEPSAVSRQHATLLLDAALEQGRWELSKDLVRFLRAIDPNDVESPRTSWGGTTKLGGHTQTPPLSPHEDDLSLVLGTMQVSRSRSYSTTATPKVQSESMAKDIAPSSMLEKTRNVVMRRKKSVPTVKIEKSDTKESSAEEFFIDVILQRHARRLLSARRLLDLGRFAAHLDFHLVTWLGRERDRAAKIDDFIAALKAVHEDFAYPYPILSLPNLQRFRRSSLTSLRSIRSINLESPEDETVTPNFAIDLPDSGYTSLPSGRPPYTSLVSPVASLETQFPATEAKLTPNMLHDTSSVISDASTIWRDDAESIVGTGVGTVCWVSSEPIEPTEIHLASHCAPVSRAEVQLRYLLQLFLEGGCLGWAAILAVVLRDAPAMSRTVRAAHAPMQTLESITNLRDGLLTLTRWSQSECLGYRPFISSIQGQISLLCRLVLNKQQQEQEQIPENPSPGPVPTVNNNQRGNPSRSRHSSISHASASTPLEEERSRESSVCVEETGFRENYNNLNTIERSSEQSTCIIC